MTITEFIAKLEQLRREHGDLQVAAVDRSYDLSAAQIDVAEALNFNHGDYSVGEKLVVVEVL